MTKALELTGMKFGHLTVIRRANPEEYGEAYKHDRGHIRWIVECECGIKKVYPGSRIKTKQLTSCGCLNGKYKAPGEAAKWAYFLRYKIHAKRRKKEFLLSLEQFLNITSSDCHYCGAVPKSGFSSYRKKSGSKKYYGEYKHNGIDRLNSSIGYIENNCVPCCSSCNYAKAEMSVDDFKEWIIKVHAHLIVNAWNKK